MIDLGEILSSLMTGLIRARHSADEHTAALAELYKDNPLLEGLSVPRIRIPELTIDLPLLIESHEQGEQGVLNEPGKIAEATASRLKNTLASNNIKVSSAFQKTFIDTAKLRLNEAQLRTGSVSRELVSRTVQEAFAETLKKTNTELSPTEKAAVVREIRAESGVHAVSKPTTASRILTNVRTTDVKDKSTGTSVVRLKITLSEEGLEWATQNTESGGVTRTLVPE